MSGLSANLEKGEYREVLFWLLLLGSWQFLASPGGKNGIVGALGTAAFLVFAVDQHGPIERRWTRSCTLVVYRRFQLGVRSGERRPRRHRDFRDRNFVGAKYEAER
jgi:hypothetical protein